MKNLRVTLPDEMVARLDRLIAIEESSRAALVRKAVQTFLTSKERELEAREMVNAELHERFLVSP